MKRASAALLLLAVLVAGAAAQQQQCLLTSADVSKIDFSVSDGRACGVPWRHPRPVPLPNTNRHTA